MTKIKMLVMGALVAGFVAGVAPRAMADEGSALYNEYGYQNDHSVKKRVAEPSFMANEHHMKKHHAKKHHMKKKKMKMKKKAAMSHHNYPNECNKPPCNGTSN